MKYAKALYWLFPPLALRQIEYWRKSWNHRMARYGFELASVYGAIVLLLVVFENRLLYHPTHNDDWAAPPASFNFSDVFLPLGDGTQIHVWWCPIPNWTPEQGALIYFHGNQGNLSHRLPEIIDFQKNLRQAVLILDYPGYGKSEGNPNETGCYRAGDASYEWLMDKQGLDPNNIILFGGSLGGGVAVDLASRKPHRALVLISTFTSIPEVAQKIYFFAPVRYLARNQFDNLGKIAKCNRPLFMAHGTADTLIPISLAQRLFDQATNPKTFFPIVGGTHNEVFSRAAFAALDDFLAQSAPLK